MMAKYTKTSIAFFLKLSWKEGMAYFHDISELAQAERDALDDSKTQAQQRFDPSVWHRWKQ